MVVAFCYYVVFLIFIISYHFCLLPSAFCLIYYSTILKVHGQEAFDVIPGIVFDGETQYYR